MCDIIRCLICMRDYKGMFRYPNAVCNDCINIYGLFVKNGNKIIFGNIDEHGGVKSITTIGDTQIEGNETQCFINGNECCVEEAKFGGIVISPIPNQNKRHKKIKI